MIDRWDALGLNKRNTEESDISYLILLLGNTGWFPKRGRFSLTKSAGVRIPVSGVELNSTGSSEDVAVRRALSSLIISIAILLMIVLRISLPRAESAMFFDGAASKTMNPSVRQALVRADVESRESASTVALSL